MSASLRTSASVLTILLLCILWPVARHTLFPGFAAGSWIGAAFFVALPIAALGRSALTDLGLDRLHRRGFAVGLGGSLLMVAAFVAFGAKPAVPAAADFLHGTLVAAIAEEVLFRGYAVRRLHERARWPLPVALAVPAVLFGLGHLAGALAEGQAGNPVMTVLVTAAGGVWFGWLFVRWEYSLWVPIAVHAAMNAWWLVFSAGPTAGSGGPAALWGRVATITVISVLTARLTRKRSAEP